MDAEQRLAARLDAIENRLREQAKHLAEIRGLITRLEHWVAAFERGDGAAAGWCARKNG